jgi:tetratricopeptide (TPR) repeat protein
MKNRHMLALGILSWAVAGLDAASAQTTGASNQPSAFLAAPADGVDFYLKTETAARLVEEEKWPEAEALLLELTRAYPFSSAYAPNRSNWGRLGMVLQQQGKHAAAIEACKKRTGSSFRTAAWAVRSPGFDGSSATHGMNDGRLFRRSRSS